MRLGLVIQHYDARNDIRELVALLRKRVDLVLLARPGGLGRFQTDCEVRYFTPKARLWRWFWLQAFRFLGELPESRNNYLVTELFKLHQLSGLAFKRRMWPIRLRLAQPGMLSADLLMRCLRGTDCTPIADIDAFLFVTEFSDASFLARVCNSGKPTTAYVYSWDHPCKHPVMPRGLHRYLVWNDDIREDMIRLQHIPRTACVPIGATQLAVVKEYLESPEFRVRRLSLPYFYFGCGTGVRQMAVQELLLIEHVAGIVEQQFPNHKLLVRPYPLSAQAEFVGSLRTRRNVILDDSYREGRSDRSLSHADLIHKLNLQEHAAAFLHIGTTMGLEGAYLPSPVLTLDPEDFSYGVPPGDCFHLRKFTQQYHLQRHVLLDGYPNVIRRIGDLAGALQGTVDRREEFLAYNRAMAERTPLQSMEWLADRMLGLTVAPSELVGSE